MGGRGKEGGFGEKDGISSDASIHFIHIPLELTTAYVALGFFKVTQEELGGRFGVKDGRHGHQMTSTKWALVIQMIWVIVVVEAQIFNPITATHHPTIAFIAGDPTRLIGCC